MTMVLTKPGKRTIAFTGYSHNPAKKYHLFFPEFVFHLEKSTEPNGEVYQFCLAVTTTDKKIIPIPNITYRGEVCINHRFSVDTLTKNTFLMSLQTLKQIEWFEEPPPDTEILNYYINQFWKTTFCDYTDSALWKKFFTAWEKTQPKTWLEIFKLHCEKFND